MATVQEMIAKGCWVTFELDGYVGRDPVTNARRYDEVLAALREEFRLTSVEFPLNVPARFGVLPIAGETIESLAQRRDALQARLEQSGALEILTDADREPG